jgi:hypothetical protein
MPNASSRVSHTSKKAFVQSRRKGRNYPGELIAEKLIEWLNELDPQLKKALANPPNQIKAPLRQEKNAVSSITRAQKRRERVETIIGLWQSLTDYASEVARPYRHEYYGVPPAWEIEGGKEIREKLEHDRDHINSLLRRYSGRTMLVGINNKSLAKIVGRHGSGMQIGGTFDVRDELKEWDSIQAVIRLAADGHLGKVQRCEYCKRWLYKRFKHQTCCSDGKCRQNKYRSSPEWKEHRRKWQRANYQTHKEMDQGRALTVSKRRIVKKRRG